MSASEKLKALEKMQNATPWVQIIEGECKRVFPQIVAVIEAAEQPTTATDQSGIMFVCRLCGWEFDFQHADDCPLAALDEVLT